jgi:uncharacterized protein
MLSNRSALVGLMMLTLAAATAQAQSKKELVAKVLQLQQPGIEAMAAAMAQQPAAQIAQQVGPAMQRLPADRREALGRDIDADLRKYVDEAVPIVRERALKLAPTTIGPLLEERFTEDELKQLVSILESPVNRKWQGMAPDMQKVLTEKLVPEARPLVDPKARAMAESVNARMRTAMQQAAPAAGPAASVPRR